MNFKVKTFLLILSVFIITGCTVNNDNNKEYEEIIINSVDEEEFDLSKLVDVQSERLDLFFYKGKEVLYVYVFEEKMLLHSSSFNYEEVKEDSVFWNYNEDDFKDNKSLIWGKTNKDTLFLNNQPFEPDYISLDDINIFYKILDTKLNSPVDMSANRK
ncbi:hypothetical protein [Paenisporosarcina sp. TG20]|uniref:hypothetical protein n=1 Tax=Paenisporosarcina sp. TG20 TaxID=1211706 RepID=UPI00178C6EA8|nr:hypothetical protein [Paenisporosarcina sp. TG20]